MPNLEFDAMNVHHWHQVFALFVLVTVSFGCDRSPHHRIIGKWQEVGGAHMMQFFPDGTLVITVDKNTQTVNYSFPDSSHLKINEGGALTVVETAVTSSSLTITYHRNPTDHVIKLLRVE
jgi:hypothetical protein